MSLYKDGRERWREENARKELRNLDAADRITIIFDHVNETTLTAIVKSLRLGYKIAEKREKK